MQGSVQNIGAIPAEVRELFRTVWELDPALVLDMAADRGPYIDQSQSTSIHLINVTTDRLVSCPRRFPIPDAFR